MWYDKLINETIDKMDLKRILFDYLRKIDCFPVKLKSQKTKEEFISFYDDIYKFYNNDITLTIYFIFRIDLTAPAHQLSVEWVKSHVTITDKLYKGEIEARVYDIVAERITDEEINKIPWSEWKELMLELSDN